MTFQESRLAAMAPNYQVGVAIKATRQKPQRMHVGLVYFNSQDEVRFAHLAWHNDLRDDPAPNNDGYLWADCEWLADDGSDSLADFVASFIEMCTLTREIPYGPHAPAAAFDERGHYRSDNRREGLTCATFIASILQGAGVPVVKLETWESREEDKEWWADVSDILDHLAPERADELRDIPIEYRLRPDEVAVAAQSVDRPLSFRDASVRSGPLHSLLFPTSHMPMTTQELDRIPAITSKGDEAGEQR